MSRTARSGGMLRKISIGRMAVRRLTVLLTIMASSGACQRSSPAPTQHVIAATDTDPGASTPDRKAADSLLKSGTAAYKRSDFATAISAYTGAIRLDPACAKAYYFRGEARREIGEFRKADDDYTDAIRLDPNWAIPYLSRAVVHRDMGLYTKVIADCTVSIRLRPDLALAFHVRGGAYSRKREFEKAIADYSAAARLEPTACRPYHERGMVYKEMGENGKAEADLKHARELGYGQCAGSGQQPRAVPSQRQAIHESSTIPLQELTTSTAQKELVVDLGKGVKLGMVLIPTGEFVMGSPDSDDCADDTEKPQHRVRIANSFYLGKYPVTQEQWRAAMGTNPSSFKGPKNPVDSVNWDDCQQFLEKLNTKIAVHGWRFELPSEAPWEYACRAGSTTRYCFGDDHSGLDEYAWHEANSGRMTHPVGEKKPNAWGLYDMHGNVWEWCKDWYDPVNYKESPVVPPGPTGEKVQRGGSWKYGGGLCRSANRAGAPPENRTGAGFRVALVRADREEFTGLRMDFR